MRVDPGNVRKCTECQGVRDPGPKNERCSNQGGNLKLVAKGQHPARVEEKVTRDSKRPPEFGMEQAF